MKKTHNYNNYEDYLNHQKTKTLDPVKRKKWLNEEWELKLKGFQKVFSRFSSVLGKKALCIGARTGQEVVALKNLGVEAIGIDLVPHGENVLQGDMHSLDFPDNGFDFVFSNVFDHSLDPSKKISEIERVLNVGGHALLQFQIGIDQDRYTEVEIDLVDHDILPLFQQSFCVVNKNIARNFAGMNYEILMKKDAFMSSLYDKVGNVTEILVPEEYKKIWNDINLPIQTNKGNVHGIRNEKLDNCLDKLSKRAYYLVSIAEHIGAKNIVEVGTAQGWQFYSFAHYADKHSGQVFSCDIKDVRNEEYKNRYQDSTTFCLGDSKQLANILEEAEEKIDLFYIDGSHERTAVLKDILNLRKFQSDKCVWVFDDYDSRFGCFHEIQKLRELNNNFKVYRVGDAASGNPNHQVLIVGKI